MTLDLGHGLHMRVLAPGDGALVAGATAFGRERAATRRSARSG